MARKEKIFRITIDQIKATLDRFNARLNEFVDNVLIPNQKKREKN